MKIQSNSAIPGWKEQIRKIQTESNEVGDNQNANIGACDVRWLLFHVGPTILDNESVTTIVMVNVGLESVGKWMITVMVVPWPQICPCMDPFTHPSIQFALRLQSHPEQLPPVGVRYSCFHGRKVWIIESWSSVIWNNTNDGEDSIMTNMFAIETKNYDHSTEGNCWVHNNNPRTNIKIDVWW